MRARHPLSFVLVVTALAVPMHLAAQVVTDTTAKLKWGPAPAAFPPGARMAVESGDPTKGGMFVVRLAFPDGYRIPPHFHPTDENVQVQEGSFLVGMGDTLDLAKTKRMGPGESGSIKAGMRHFAAASGPTVVTVSAMGPFSMTYVNSMDDPRHVHKP